MKRVLRVITVAGVLLNIGLFAATIMISTTSLESSSQLAQLQLRERQAQAKQQVLQEQLAQARSLRTLMTYTEHSGFEAVNVVGTLNLTTPVAQR